MHGIVIRNTGNSYVVRTDDGQEVECKVKGNFRLRGIRSTSPVAVGDGVTVMKSTEKATSKTSGKKGKGRKKNEAADSGEFQVEHDETLFITEIDDRRNYIVRKASNLSKQSHILAANVDLALLVVTMARPETSTPFIDRFLASAEAYRVPTALVFNKMDDLSEEERERRMEFLRFAVDEIRGADWKEGDEEELLQKRTKINNLEKILFSVKEALEYISSDGGACDALRGARRALNAVAGLDKEYEKLTDTLENIAEEAEDASSALSEIADGLYFDENEATYVENRLDELRSLQRKYGVKTQEEIVVLLSEKEREYDALANSAERSEKLRKEISGLLKKILESCGKLTAIRKKAAEKFCAGVCDELKTLNIPHAQFSAAFREYADEEAVNAGENGLDSISFMFSANAGEPQKPLGKIISGGEMSRLMLAMKTRLSDTNGISTYVFDEIDAGISGKTAKVVGEKFAKIAKTTQIIAVSHLAQIACMSDGEFLIEKKEENGKTRTFIRALSAEEQKEEIVRLLGGEQGEQAAYLHAEELLQRAREFKAAL